MIAFGQRQRSLSRFKSYVAGNPVTGESCHMRNHFHCCVSPNTVLVLLDSNEFQLAQYVLWQPGNFDATPGGLVRSVELLVDGVKFRKVTHVLQEDLSMTDLQQSRFIAK
jgi:hypothetical protein